MEEISSTDQLDPKFKEASLNDMEISDDEDEEDEADDVNFMVYRINTFEDPDQVLR